MLYPLPNFRLCLHLACPASLMLLPAAGPGRAVRVDHIEHWAANYQTTVRRVQYMYFALLTTWSHSPVSLFMLCPAPSSSIQ